MPGSTCKEEDLDFEEDDSSLHLGRQYIVQYIMQSEALKLQHLPACIASASSRLSRKLAPFKLAFGGGGGNINNAC